MAFAEWAMVKLLGYSTEEGSRQLVWAAVGGGDEKRLRGGYVSFSDIVEVSDYVISETGLEAQEKIWVSSVFGVIYFTADSITMQAELIDILSKVDEKIPKVIESCLTSD